MDRSQCTKWPQLGDPEFYLDVIITRAKYSYEMKEENALQKYCEEYAMSLANVNNVTIEKILDDGKGKVTLIEGDPGCGKTTLTLQICKKWAEGKMLTNKVLIAVPLRCYALATNTQDLFKVIENLGCPLPGMNKYAQQNNGEGLVLILDGWDELPNELQVKSLFNDIVFSRDNRFFRSTIIVTSRPSCCESIAKVVQQRKVHYQILGFSPDDAESYIKHYFNDNIQTAELLITMLKGQEYLRRHFYIPITVAIMCYVYNDKGKIPETLSKLYKDFVLLYICSNGPETYRNEFIALTDVPKKLKPVFDKLCKAAYDMLRDKRLVFDEDILRITDNDLMTLDLDSKHFDGLGLLHVDYYPTKQATTKRCYSFIHRAIQELMAAICVLNTGNITDILDEHFYLDSYLINMFPFLFGLVSKDLLVPLAEKLIQIFNKCDKSRGLLSLILYCLFEAHDETLGCEFGQVFSEQRAMKVQLYTLLDCHYAGYFISVCGVKSLNVTMGISGIDLNICCEIVAKHLLNRSTDIVQFHLISGGTLSHHGMEHFAKIISTQPNIQSVILTSKCQPGCISIFCESIHKSKSIATLILRHCTLNENDLDRIGDLLKMLSLENLGMNCEVDLDSSYHFCKMLSKVKALRKLFWYGLSQADSNVFSTTISSNCSLKELCVNVDDTDCLHHILHGLSFNTSITTFRAWPSKTSISNTLGKHLEDCLTHNHTLNTVDLTDHDMQPLMYVSCLHTQVSSICTGLCANTSVVTLDISGCYIDTEACGAVCGMLSKNTTLQHLFLNPVSLEKQEAIAMIDGCSSNATITMLSLVQWPPKTNADNHKGENPFQYSCDPEIQHVLQNILKLRHEKDEPLLDVFWKWNEYEKIKKQIISHEWWK